MSDLEVLSVFLGLILALAIGYFLGRGDEADKRKAKLEATERIINALDIEGLKSWAQAIVDEWKRGERDYSAMKVAEKILAGLARGER